MADRDDYLEELNSFRSTIAMNGNLNHSRPARDPKTLYEQFKRMDSHEISTPVSSVNDGKQVVTKDESQMLRESSSLSQRRRSSWLIFCRPEPQFVQESSLDEIEDKTALELRELEELEADYQRLALRSHSSKEDFPSPSTYYFILQAIGKNFHPHCFCCFDCGRCLDGLPFCVDSEDRVFCMEDYERLFIPTCARCNNPIKASNSYGQIVRVVAMDDREYHIGCYSCEGCGMQLTNEEHRRCFPIGDHLLCKTCHNRWQKMGGLSSPLTDL
ncbi:LIM domain-containing protein jub [Aphelenchoides besseyi]|nr:LIM domain-containing protein jub [Aphelenchoides besseyi]